MISKIVRFSKFNIFGLVLSLIVTAGLVGLTVYRGGFNLGVDFRSGQSVEVLIPSLENISQITDVIISDFPQAIVTQTGASADKTFNIKIASTAEEQNEKFVQLETQLKAQFSDAQILGSSFIGGTLSKKLFRSALSLTGIALLLILLYIGVRFKFRFALAAIIALLHDALFVLGVIGALQIEVTVSTVAAVLTIIGYSLNDTIVIFDRIRENLVLMKGTKLENITDTAITKTLSRTVITTLTTVLAVISIYIFASGDIQNFAKTLLIGLIEGVWSSIFIATPVLYALGAKKMTRVSSSSTEISTKEEVIHSAERGVENTKAQLNDDVASKAAKIREEIKAQRERKKHK